MSKEKKVVKTPYVSILAQMVLSSTPLVWAVSTEEYRLLNKEQSALLNGSASQVFRYDALDMLKEAVIHKGDGTTEGGRSEQFQHPIEAINWFCKPNPPEGDPLATTAADGVLGSATNYAPKASVLFLFDVPSRIEHKNCSRWTDPLINRTIKNSIVSLIDERKTIVIVSHTMDVPQELEHVVVIVEHPLPTFNDLSKVVLRTWKHNLGKIKEDGTCDPMPDISTEELELVTGLLSGMREGEAENVLARSACYVQCKCLSDPDFPRHFDIPTIRKEKVKNVRKNPALEIVEPPGSLDQVGGLAEVKAWAHEVKDLFSKAAAADGITCPKGIVLAGPGGCGKTYTISCLGAFLNRTVLRWDVGASKGRYVGQTEEQTRSVFRDAKAQAPCILFIDEAGKLFPDAKGQGSGLDGGVSQGMYAALLTFMQESDGGVLIAMACNEDIMNFPAPALRAERIDRVFFIDLPTEEEVKDVLRIHISKSGWDPQSPELDLSRVAAALVDYTPAEVKTVVNRGLILKFHSDGPRPAPLKTQHLLDAAVKVLPMSRGHRVEIDAFRVWATQRGYITTVAPAKTATPVRKAAVRRIGSALAAITDEESDD